MKRLSRSPVESFFSSRLPHYRRCRCTRIKHLRNVRMVHHRQRLTLGFEAGHHFAGVHADFDDFERNAAFDRLPLLGHINDAEAAFAQFLQQLVFVDDGARAFGHGRRRERGHVGFVAKKPARSFVRVDQRFDARSKLRVFAARSLQVGGAGFCGSEHQRLLQDRLFIGRVCIHDIGLRKE